jgi:hypothetical protein
MASQQDVAERARVSFMTVSRVVNNRNRSRNVGVDFQGFQGKGTTTKAPSRRYCP